MSVVDKIKANYESGRWSDATPIEKLVIDTGQVTFQDLINQE